MEAEDELIPEPDARGFLDLTNRAWVHLDPVLWTMSMSVVALDISYNQLNEIPAEIGELVLLRELRASFNKIVVVAPEIGRLRRLRKLILNGNRIQSLPEEIGRLESLEELILSENAIELLPTTISLMAALRIFKLQNNKLRKLPFELAEVLTLEEIDCSNNKKLDMVPLPWRGDTESVLFVCKVHRDYHMLMEEMRTTNSDLSKHSKELEHEQLVMKETIAELRFKTEEFKKKLPPKVLARIEKEMKAKEEGNVVSNYPCNCVIA